MAADWARHCIWWQVYPLGFLGAPIREAHDRQPRLRQLENWLDYAIELGTSGLLLGPVFESETHGYDSLDQFAIDGRLGDLDDFDHLVEACHKRGLRILLDGVFNHVGSRHNWVQRALTEGPDGEYANFFSLDWSDPASPRLATFEGHQSLVSLNHANPAVLDYVEQVMTYWLARGVDGWRLDAAYAVPTRFWASLLPRVRSRFPDAWFLGEVIHGPYDEFIEDSTIDSLTQYELWKATWSSLKDKNYWELDAALERHNGFLDHQIPNTFVGNHDVTRIATEVGPHGAVLALAVLATVGGIPSIYYGDEQAYTGLKKEQVGGDDQIRPPMPDFPEQLSELGRSTFTVYQELLGLRRRNAWLTTARTRRVTLSNETYSYLAESTTGTDQIQVDLDVTSGHRVVISDAENQVLFTYSAD